MIHRQYAGIRDKICAPQVTVVPGEGNLSTGTYYLWIQGRSRAGFTLPSDSTAVDVNEGDRLDITLSADCRRDGEDLHRWVVVASLSDNYSTGCVIFAVEGRLPEGGLTPLPLTIEVTEDSQLAQKVEVDETLTPSLVLSYELASVALDGATKLDLPIAAFSPDWGMIEHEVVTNSLDLQIICYLSNLPTENGFGGTSGLLEIHTAIASGKFDLTYQNGGETAIRLLSTTVVSIGQSYKVKVAWDATTLSLYIDDVLEDSADISSFAVGGLEPEYTYLGGPGADLRFFDGILSNIRIWRKPAFPGEGELPQTDRLNGMRRFLKSSEKILEFNEHQIAWEPVYPQRWIEPVSNTRSTNGCNQSLAKVNERNVIVPRYKATGNIGEQVEFWLVNDGPTIVPKGVQVALSISIGEKELSPYAREIGLLEIALLGIVKVATGELDTTDDLGNVAFGIGSWLPDGGNPTGISLPKDLLPGFALKIAVRPRFNAADQTGFFEGSLIKIFPSLYQRRSQYNPVAALQPNYIAKTQDLCRIVPWNAPLSCMSLAGKGNLFGWIFEKGIQTVFGLSPNEANQPLAIATNGAVVKRSFIQPTEDVRAIVGTIDGVGKISAWQAIFLDSSLQVRVSVTHPTTIRIDYPDIIAGSLRGRFNATKVKVFIRAVDTPETIYSVESAIAPGEPQNVVDISGLNTPDSWPAPAADFGLYEPESFSLETVATSSSFPTNTYEMAIAYSFSNCVTSISHSPNRGCIREMPGNFFESDSTIKILDSATQLKAIPAPDGADDESEIYALRESDRFVYWDALSSKTDDNTDNSVAFLPDNQTTEELGRWLEWPSRVKINIIASAEALRTLPSPNLRDDESQIYILRSEPRIPFYWEGLSTVVDDGKDDSQALLPSDKATINPGRWLQLTPPVFPRSVTDVNELRSLKSPKEDGTLVVVLQPNKDLWIYEADNEYIDNGSLDSLVISPADNIGRWAKYENVSPSSTDYWLDSVANIVELKKLYPPSWGASVLVRSESKDYYWEKNSLELDKTSTTKNVILPDIVPSLVPGRFLTKLTLTS